jgi:hypothetical protein
VFGLVLGASVVFFAVTADWRTQTPLDFAAFAVSLIAITGVLSYALRAALRIATFWLWFRWIFLATAGAQVTFHALLVARDPEFSIAGSVAFFAFALAIMSPLFYFQWLAMTRLAGVEPKRRQAG